MEFLLPSLRVNEKVGTLSFDLNMGIHFLAFRYFALIGNATLLRYAAARICG
jgi:hypothetical protein